jgi:EAL and modified HD-GYP domain-containing signal transduction protein
VPAGASSAIDVCVARQPIFDRWHKLYGYELLYRSSARATDAGYGDAGNMSSATLVQAVLGIGLASLTGNTLAFVNFPRELLLSHEFDVLHPAQCVIEILESVPCDADTVAACQDLRSKGFTIALDDFMAGAEYAPILALSQIVKIDVLGRTKEDIAAQVARLRPYNVALLAEKIDSAEVNAMCRKLGFRYFQGFYFQKPEVVQRRDLPMAMVAVVRLMNLVVDPSTHDRALEEAFGADPGLSYKLLQIANSAGFGVTGIATIGQAIRLVGRGPLRRWLSLLLLSFVPRKDGVATELVLTSLQRAWLCETMAAHSGRSADASSLFLTGLLSNFDSILGLSRQQLLHRINVSAEVEAALLFEAGPFTPYVAAATALLNGEFDTVEELASPMGLRHAMPGWLSEASVWARDVIGGLESGC